MEKERGFKNAIILLLVVAVLGLSVAFALFESQLTVNGTAKVLSSGNNWNVNFSEVSADHGGYATSTAETSDDAKTTITFDCSISSSEDSCTLNGTIKNSGKINAKYKGYTLQLDSSSVNDGVTEVSNDDIKVTLTPPVGWVKDTKVLKNNDTGSFTLTVNPEDGITFNEGTSGDETYTITLTFDFEQADASAP